MTRYGDPIDRVIYLDEKAGMADVEMLDRKGRKTCRGYMLHQLRADGGIREILDAAETRKS